MNLQDIIKSAINDTPYQHKVDQRLVNYAKELSTKPERIITQDSLKNELHRLANRTEKEYQLTENNTPVINALWYWFNRLPQFKGYCEHVNSPELTIFANRPSLKKGIILCGPYGVGKTTIIEAFIRLKFPGMQFKEKRCQDIISEWEEKNLKYYTTGNWFFDELGFEGQAPFSKKESKLVMAKILEERYHKMIYSSNQNAFTIITTNLAVEDFKNGDTVCHGLKSIYGPVMGDRWEEMFNIIILLGTSFRN